jgi:hypothetical protein
MIRRFANVRNEQLLAIALAAVLGCSGSPSPNEPDDSATGGARDGGNAGSATSAGNGGEQLGGATAIGGVSALAGGIGIGGNNAVAGASPQGGGSGIAGDANGAGRGGSPNTGGSPTTGSTGGRPGGANAGGNAGSSAKGGASGSAGKTSAGGNVNTGGSDSAGGASGSAGKGGASGPGGNANTGGTSGSTGKGGTTSTAGTGGNYPNGGSVTTAGTAGAAGSSGVSCPSAKILCGASVGGKDSDCDGIADSLEIGSDVAHPIDTDGDGKPDYLDDDSDADGIPDNVEVGSDCSSPRDSDGDKIPDYRDTDSDNNGIKDSAESSADTDGDGLVDGIDLDDDGDLLPDTMEIGPNPSSPLDTDADGTPDIKDRDSDGDTILDHDERAGDPDGDGIPNFRDRDSDKDGISDAIEAGDANLTTPPVDTDSDGLPDFVDLDSDGDGLIDAAEDKNGNGILDTGESSRTKTDSDGDGVSDLVEVAAGTDPLNAGDNPAAHGNFYFTVPYTEPPNPTRGTFDFATKISRADAFFLMDTTGSMGGCISNLQTSLSSVIIPQLAAQIASIGIGIGSYRDFPTSSYGSTGDWPFQLEHRIMTVTTAAGIASVQSRVGTLSAGGGNDTNESSWEALHQVATGTGNTTGLSSVPAFNNATAYPTTPTTGESLGTIPGAGFRTGALPIITYITDAPGHNTDTATVTASDYLASSGIVSTRSTQAIAELRGIGARVIGVTPGTTGSVTPARYDQLAVVNATATTVPPTAWGTGTSRPTGCGATQCCTGVSGAGEAVDTSGNCPLSFLVDTSGAGLGSAIVTAIQVLTTYGTMNISARPVDDPSDAVNAVSAFIDSIVANPTAGAPCDTGLTAADTDGDGRLDTFVGVKPGKRACFDVVPKSNVTVLPTTAPQMFKAAIEVIGDSVAVLDTRNVYFLVPPTVQ